MALTLQIGGKERGIKFTMLSLEKFEEKIPLTKVPENSKLIYATFWAGLIGYTSAKDQEEDYTYEDVQDWVDQMYLNGRQEEIKMVCEEWEKADMFKNRLREIENAVDKIRSLTEEPAETPKKKAKSTTSGLKLKSLPLEV